MAHTSSNWSPSDETVTPPKLLLLAVAAAWLCLGYLALGFVLLRFLSGATHQTVPFPAIAALGLLGCVTAAAVEALCTLLVLSPAWRRAAVTTWLLLAGAVCFHQLDLKSTLVLMMPAILTAVGLQIRRQGISRNRSERHDNPTTPAHSVQSTQVAPTDPPELQPPDVLPLRPGAIFQQVTRLSTGSDTELAEGFIQVCFAPGQRTASIHVAFCPPFKRQPTITVQQQTGPKAVLRTGQILPSGVRIDVRLSSPAQQAAVLSLYLAAHGQPDCREDTSQLDDLFAAA